MNKETVASNTFLKFPNSFSQVEFLDNQKLLPEILPHPQMEKRKHFIVEQRENIDVTQLKSNLQNVWKYPGHLKKAIKRLCMTL